jgi:replicative DNA helicase
METKIIDQLKKFGNEFQIKCISSLLSDKSFLERISDIVDPTSYETDAHQWIVKTILSYFMKYKDLPTLNVFKIQVDTIDSELLKRAVTDQLRVVYQKISDSDINFVKEQYLEFCKNQKMKGAILDSVDLIKNGQYDKISHIVQDALKAGMERNVGHTYMSDIDSRMSVMARNTLKTNWVEVDSVMDGGLAPGELGVITACAGAGKCVGPNTEIEIEYHEIGIEITGNSGKKYVMWINPLKKYEFDGNLLFGWQIENVIFELKKLNDMELVPDTD